MDAVFIVLLWIALGIAFICGTLWNTGAYTRGYDDGWRDGFNNGIGREDRNR